MSFPWGQPAALHCEEYYVVSRGVLVPGRLVASWQSVGDVTVADEFVQFELVRLELVAELVWLVVWHGLSWTRTVSQMVKQTRVTHQPRPGQRRLASRPEPGCLFGPTASAYLPRAGS